MRTSLLVFLTICLAACGKPQVREPLPTPGSAYLAYPHYLQPTADRFVECAAQQSPFSLFLIPNSASHNDLSETVLQLQLGGTIPAGWEAYQIGEEDIVFIVNNENPMSILPTERLLAVYTGQQEHWDFGENQLIRFISYPAEDSLRSFLESVLPGAPRVSSRALIAPSPDAVLIDVSENPEAIGYVPSGWLSSLVEDIASQVKVVELDPSLTVSLIQPILVTVDGPFSPEVQGLLACMQRPES